MMMQRPEIQRQESEDDEIDLGELLATLWAGKAIVAAASAASVIAAAGYLWLASPTYEANALLQIQDNKSMLALPSSMMELLGDEGASALAEMEIIRSRQILGRAVADLNLD